jgi:hypothetical protein
MIPRLTGSGWTASPKAVTRSSWLPTRKAPYRSFAFSFSVLLGNGGGPAAGLGTPQARKWIRRKPLSGEASPHPVCENMLLQPLAAAKH